MPRTQPNTAQEEGVIALPTVTPMMQLLSSLSLGASLVEADGKYKLSGAGVKKHAIPGDLVAIANAHDYLEPKLDWNMNPIPNTSTLTAKAMTDLVAGKVQNDPPAADAVPLAEEPVEEAPEAEVLTEAPEAAIAPEDDAPLPEEPEEPPSGDVIAAELTAAMGGTAKPSKRSKRGKRK